MKRRRCKNCNKSFVISSRHPEQKYCSRKECQKARKNNWQRRKLSSDEDYRKNQADCQERWVEKHPGYWKQYRKKNPESARRNKEKQRGRNRINRRQPPSKSPSIANMDAKQPQKPLIQTSLREVILPPDFWTLCYLRGESPTSIWSNFPAGVTTLS